MEENLFNIFVGAYVDTMLWSTTDWKPEEPNDDSSFQEDGYTIDDLADETLKKVQEDCSLFLVYVASILDVTSHNVESVAHDFWLTRERHGAGFWDGDYEKELGDKLTKISDSFGEFPIYLGDDGKIYA